MTTTRPVAYSEQVSEAWLLERTYHARLRSGRDASVPKLTQAMKQLTNFSVPISTWQEISPAEAHAAYQDGIPVLLYGENTWEHLEGASASWGAGRNMRTLIFGDTVLPVEEVAGIEYAVRYLDAHRGNSSNAAWRAWFASDSATIFDGSDRSAITFFGPCFQFPSTTHYTVIAADGHIHEYANSTEAIQGFEASLPQERDHGSSAHTVIFPQFCYYHEVTCPSGVYRLEFFGPHMDEQGYQVRGGGGKRERKHGAVASWLATVLRRIVRTNRKSKEGYQLRGVQEAHM